MLLSQPLVGAVVLTFGAMAVFAGVIAVQALLTGITAVQVTAQGFGAAMFDGPHGLALTRQHQFPVFGPVGRSVAAEDVS